MDVTIEMIAMLKSKETRYVNVFLELKAVIELAIVKSETSLFPKKIEKGLKFSPPLF